MRELSVLLEQYLQTRRAAGAKLKDPEWLVRQFLSFLAQRQATVITTELALQWAIEPRNVQPFYRHRRLAEVRRFARYASAVDSRHEIPPQGLLPYRKHRAQPYIYTAEEIVAVINAAKQLRGRIRPLTYSIILGLLSVTAMRSGEVVNLDRDDVDLRQGLITIGNAKFGKSRMVTCHQSTRKVLSEYAARRDELLPCPISSAFFVSDQGKRISPHMLRNTFANLSRATGLRGVTDTCGPRLQDIRHTYVVHTLMQWYRDDIDVECWLPRLSTWLGHVGIGETYWYLSAVPQLMEQAARKLDCAQTRMHS